VCLCVCDQETPKREAKGPSWTISAEIPVSYVYLCFVYFSTSRSRWPRSVRRRSWPLVAGNVSLNPARGMDVCLYVCVVLSCVVRGLSDGLVARPRGFYCAFKTSVYYNETKRRSIIVSSRLKTLRRGQGPIWAVVPYE
jgi:hypothetical protein